MIYRRSRLSPDPPAALRHPQWPAETRRVGTESADTLVDFKINIAASISQALGVRAEKGYACHTVARAMGETILRSSSMLYGAINHPFANINIP